MAGIKLPKNACRIIVQSMVNPGIFWVAEPADAEMSLEREKLQRMEELLQKHCKPNSYRKMVGNYLPEVGELVAVQHPDTNRWHRAKVNVIGHLVRGYLYDVFLVDHGIGLKVRSSSIKELSPNWDGLNYQSYQVILYGIVPVTLDMDYDEMKMKQVVAASWTPASMRFTTKLLNECTEAFVVSHSFGERKVYGDLYLQTKTGLISLKEKLCYDEYAISDEENFKIALGLTEETLLPKARDFSSPSSSSTDGGSVSRILNHNSKNIKHRTIRDYLAERDENKARQKAEERRKLNEIKVEEGEEIDEDLVGIDYERPIGRGYSRKKMESSSRTSHKKRLYFSSMKEVANYDLKDLYEADKKYSDSLLEEDKKSSVKQKPMMSGWQHALLITKSVNSKTKSDENVKSVDNHDENSIKSVDDATVKGQTEGKNKKPPTQLSSLLEFLDNMPK